MVAVSRSETPPILTLVPTSGIAPLPEAALYGWTGEYVAAMHPVTEAPIQFHLATALTIAGAVIGRRIGMRVGAHVTYPNFYTLLVGSTGRSRKDTSAELGFKMIRHWIGEGGKEPDGSYYRKWPFHRSFDVSSAEGLITQLAEYPQLLLYLSEFKGMMLKARRESTSTIKEIVLEAYNNPDQLENNSKTAPVAAIDPSFSILGLTQPQILQRLITPDEIESGFLNRFLIIYGEGERPIPFPPDLHHPTVVDLATRLLDRINVYPTGTILQMSELVAPEWTEWYRADWYAERDEDEQNMTTRHQDLVKKIALVHAITDGVTEIRRCHFEAALTTVDWMWGEVKRNLGFWGESKASTLERRLIEKITEFGPIKRRDLQQKVRCRDGREAFNKAIDALQKSGVIAVEGGIIKMLH